MEKIELNQSQLDKLVKFDAGYNVISTEADIYYYPMEHKSENRMMAFKYFYGHIPDKKQHIIDDIDKNRRSLQSIDALVLPENQIVMDDEIVGFIMPFINNVNLADILTSKSYSEKAKLQYIKKIGEVLNKMRELRIKDNNLNKLFLGDLHEGNVVIDSVSGELRIIDIDSISINDDEPSKSRYLYLNDKLLSQPEKYPYYDLKSGILKSSENTDLYCYYTMIFNYLLDYPFKRVDSEEYLNYLNYLGSNGVDNSFLDKAERIYTPQDNLNPFEDLDSLINVKEKGDIASYASYHYYK